MLEKPPATAVGSPEEQARSLDAFACFIGRTLTCEGAMRVLTSKEPLTPVTSAFLFDPRRDFYGDQSAFGRMAGVVEVYAQMPRRSTIALPGF